jgi:hypothetical protein
MKLDINNIPFDFGRYQHYSANEVAAFDPNYIVRIYYINPKPPISESLYMECQHRRGGDCERDNFHE